MNNTAATTEISYLYGTKVANYTQYCSSPISNVLIFNRMMMQVYHGALMGDTRKAQTILDRRHVRKRQLDRHMWIRIIRRIIL